MTGGVLRIKPESDWDSAWQEIGSSSSGAEGSSSAFGESSRDSGVWTEQEFKDAQLKYSQDKAWKEGIEDEWDLQSAFNDEGEGVTADGVKFAEFMREKLWDRFMDERGFGDRHTRAKFDEMRALRDRDHSSEGVAPSPWQEDLQRKARGAARNIAARQRVYGGNQMMGEQSLRKALGQMNSMMVEKIREGRVEEGRVAGNALEALLSGAAKEGRQAAIGSEQLMAQWRATQSAADQDTLSTILSTIGTILSTAVLAYAATGSDERLKKKTGETQGAAYDYLDKMETAQYDMPMRALAGQPTNENGVMAQSLQKSELGNQMVDSSMGGMRSIDTIQGLRATMVAQKELHERMKGIENRLGVNFGGGTK